MNTRVLKLLPATAALVLTAGGVAVAANLLEQPSAPTPVEFDSTAASRGADDGRARGDDDGRARGDDDGTPDQGPGDAPGAGSIAAEDRPPRTEVRESDGRREVRTEVDHQGTQTYPAADAGAVTVTREGTNLTIDNADPASGWTHRIERTSGREVEVTFRRGGQRVDFKAEIEADRVKVRVREREN